MLRPLRPAVALVAVAAAAAAAASPTASGAVTPPRDTQFAGATSDGQALRFRTSADGRRVVAIGFASRSVRCRTGRAVTLQVRFDKRPRVRAGRFAATVEIRPRGMVTRVTIEGRFTSVNAARGTFRQRIRFTSGRRCDTGTVRWTAWRYRATPPPPPPAPSTPATPGAPTPTPAAPAPVTTSGATAGGGAIGFAVDHGARTITVTNLVQRITCTDGNAYDVTITNLGPAIGLAADGTYAAKLRPPLGEIGGRPLSGSLVELSGALTPEVLRGAARLTAGFADGSSCDGGWQQFSLPAPAAG